MAKWTLLGLIAAVQVSATGAQQQVLRSVGHGVRIDVLVTEGGRPVEGLTRADFQVSDAGVDQDVDSAVVASNVAVAIVLDTSLSVRVPRFPDVLRACSDVVRQLKTGDRAAFLAFSDRVTMVVPTTTDFGALQEGIIAAARFGSGSVPRSVVWDAVLAGLSLVAEDRGRPLVMLFSDGMDNASVVSKDELTKAFSTLGTGVDFFKTPWDPASFDRFGPGRQAPEDLPNRTGGVVVDALDRNLARDLSRRLDALRAAYVLTYIPKGVRTDDGWHGLKVKIRGRESVVRARSGYYTERRK